MQKNQVTSLAIEVPYDFFLNLFFPGLDGIALATTPSTGCQVLDSWNIPVTIN